MLGLRANMLFSRPVMLVHFMTDMPFMMPFFVMNGLRIYGAKAESS
jgi:hypothetical protein